MPPNTTAAPDDHCAESKKAVVESVLIVQADRLGSGNMRSAIQDVFPDARVTIVRSGPDAVAAAQENHHQLAVLGLSAADLVWMGKLPQILSSLKNTPVLVISGRHAPRTFRMLNKLHNISIFDPVTQGPMDLRAAMNSIARGHRFMSPSVQDLLRDHREVKPELLLSATEERVLSVIGDGADDEEASRRLALTLTTLATHRRNIMKKLDLHHRGALVRFAVRHGYVIRTIDGSLVPGLIAILSQVDLCNHSAERE